MVRRDIPGKYLALALLNLLNWTIFWYRPEGELSPDELAVMLSMVFVEGAINRVDGEAASIDFLNS